jgi:hypothetical protein
LSDEGELMAAVERQQLQKNVGVGGDGSSWIGMKASFMVERHLVDWDEGELYG